MIRNSAVVALLVGATSASRVQQKNIQELEEENLMQTANEVMQGTNLDLQSALDLEAAKRHKHHKKHHKRQNLADGNTETANPIDIVNEAHGKVKPQEPSDAQNKASEAAAAAELKAAEANLEARTEQVKNLMKNLEQAETPQAKDAATKQLE
mmetsp:Transcript_21105/g.32722  ORF Transcript_21105/g.32722 Transcript_21105/m.32722 type:complete len:153 (+) Transcript_21105:17-475(+)